MPRPDPNDLFQAYPFEEWHEDIGSVLWWRVPVSEPPYVGGPTDLGCGTRIDLTVGVQTVSYEGENVGGWPFDEEDEERLVWTLLPGAIRMPTK